MGRKHTREFNAGPFNVLSNVTTLPFLLFSSLTTLAPDEIGHNMGCYHDIANNGLDPPNDYSHGLRYCSGDVR